MLGRVPHTQVDQYYALCDILVFPRKQTRVTELVTPLKPLEAFAQGKLVAASDVGGHKELIKDGETGILFHADDPADLAQRVGDLFEQRDSWPRIHQNALRYVQEERTWARSVANYEPVYNRLMQR
jgi:glycogen synthase